MERIKMRRSRLFKHIVTIGLFICICSTFVFYGITRPYPSHRQLCRDLAQLLSYEECRNLRYGEIIEAAIQPGKTTQSEINQALGAYLYDVSLGPDNKVNYEVYELAKSLANTYIPGLFKTLYIFDYGSSGILLHYTVED